ncbi:hypothetical protein [Agromyces sp. Marseille-Q5079]|uniref:hypothetical protein n=1 Tax=Agromyces sp. Marseille-Q5079 TaxID=3439059 RepID=UPI003D9CA2FF
MGEPHVVTLRATRDTDLDTLHRFRHDPDPGPDAPDLVRRTVRADGEIVGEVASWNEGGATFVAVEARSPSGDDVVRVRALRLFVDTLPRPLFARAADDDAATAAVLGHCGFRRVDGVVHRLD